MQNLFTKVILVFFQFIIIIGLYAQDFNPSVVQHIVQQNIAQSPNDFHPIYILLEDQINFKEVEKNFQTNRIDIEQRATQTIQLLQQKAATSQTDFLQYLQNNPNVLQESIQAFWLSNAIFVRVKKEIIYELSHNPKVAWIGYNGILKFTESIDEALPSAAPAEPGLAEPGLYAVNAHALWDLGYTGYGQTVFVNDTGVAPNHPAIFSRYSGHYPDNIADFWVHQESISNPFDCNDHGTHVLGTMLGLDRLTKDTIGVAYNAQWIAASILCGGETEGIIASFQWALDRDDDANTIDDLPEVINNSWYDPFLEESDCQSIYVPILEAMHLAGIAVVFSAGNEGPDPMTITAPHNINVDTVNSFTVAATAVNHPYLVADFSSRGPSKCGGEGSLLIKPEVAAPGQDVRSCVLNGYYGLKSGTSMAAPHTSGVVLLLKEAFPYLTGRELLLAIYHSCTDLGVEGEDNTYGMGMINAGAAYDYLIAQGHVPVPPIRTNDVILVEAKVNEFECDSEINSAIIFENAGTDTLFSVEILYQTDLGANALYTWNGQLLPKEQIWLPLDALDAPVGKQRFSITLQNPNGVSDLRPLNNQLVFDIEVVENPSIVIDKATDTTCKESRAVLHFDYEGEGIVHWFEDSNQNNLIGQGTNFETAALDTTTEFYARVFYKKQLGKQDNNNIELLEESPKGALHFDALAAFTLQSVKVYAPTGGGREINLFDQRGEKIGSAVEILFSAGETRIDLDFEVPKGTDYTLTMDGGSFPFAHSEEDVNYPYEIPQIVTIKGASQDSIPSQKYFYFYDWEIEYYDICGTSNTIVEVSPTDSLPLAQFSIVQDTIDISLGETLMLESTATNFQTILWDFGNGTTSDAANPSFSYSEIGNYYITQTVWNEDGCSDEMTLPIVVIDDTFVSNDELSHDLAIQIYPNPSQDIVHIAWQDAQATALKVFDTNGRLIYQQVTNNSSSYTQISLQNWPKGLYYVLLEGDTWQVTEKLVKQ